MMACELSIIVGHNKWEPGDKFVFNGTELVVGDYHAEGEHVYVYERRTGRPYYVSTEALVSHELKNMN